MVSDLAALTRALRTDPRPRRQTVDAGGPAISQAEVDRARRALEQDERVVVRDRHGNRFLVERREQ